jgi:hypothetical protein
MRMWPLRVISLLFLLPAGILCLLFPFAEMWPGSSALLDDTRGFFGAGTDEGVPIVHQVTCTEESYRGGSRHTWTDGVRAAAREGSERRGHVAGSHRTHVDPRRLGRSAAAIALVVGRRRVAAALRGDLRRLGTSLALASLDRHERDAVGDRSALPVHRASGVPA